MNINVKLDPGVLFSSKALRMKLRKLKEEPLL